MRTLLHSDLVCMGGSWYRFLMSSVLNLGRTELESRTLHHLLGELGMDDLFGLLEEASVHPGFIPCNNIYYYYPLRSKTIDMWVVNCVIMIRRE